MESERRRGMWSEVGFGREERPVKGKAELRSLLVKTRSSLARIGFGCLLVQV